MTQIRSGNVIIQFNAPTLSGPSGLAALTPFFFTATAGQTQFTLPSAPAAGIILLAINGAAQSEAGGDYSLSGAVITLNEGVDENDKIFGVYA